MEQSVSLKEKSLELKTNLEQIYDELRSRIGDVRKFHYLHTPNKYPNQTLFAYKTAFIDVFFFII